MGLDWLLPRVGARWSLAVPLGVAALVAGCGVGMCEGMRDLACSDCPAPGELAWEATYEGGRTVSAFALATEPCGGVVAVGTIDESGTIGSRDMWLSRYGPDGRRAWTRLPGYSEGDDLIRDVAVDDDGSIYVVGTVTSERHGAGYTNRDSWVRRYAPDGSREWTDQVDDGEYGGAESVAIAIDGDVLVSAGSLLRRYSPGGKLREEIDLGETVGAVTVADDGRVATASSSTALRVHDQDLEVLWRRADERLTDPAFRSDGSLLALRGSNRPDALLCLGHDGEELWARDLEAQYPDLHVSSVAVGPDDHPVLLILDATNVYRYRVLVTRLDPDGAPGWTWAQDWDLGTSPGALAVGDDGSIFVTARVNAGDVLGGSDLNVWIGRLAP